MKKEKAFEELGHDNITGETYELLHAIGANSAADECHFVTPELELGVAQKWNPILNRIAGWVSSYHRLYALDRLSVSDIVATSEDNDYIHDIHREETHVFQPWEESRLFLFVDYYLFF